MLSCCLCNFDYKNYHFICCVQSAATSSVTPDRPQHEVEMKSLETWMKDVEMRMEEAEGDEDKMKVGTEAGRWAPYCRVIFFNVRCLYCLNC